MMNRLDLIVRVYSYTHGYKYVPFWLLTPARKLLRFVAREVLPSYLNNDTNYVPKRQTEVIVSLTSFPARIQNVWQVVECMFRQTYRPMKTILWLSKEQFPSLESIPQSLREREGDVFEIRLVNGDIRSHKKYYYVSKEYPDAHIFLIDDDIYYPSDILERTIMTVQENPEAIVCNYGYHIGYKDDGTLKPYNKWKREPCYSEDDDLFFGSGGGTLITPSLLHRDLTDIATARLLCPIADDIWLNAMVKLAGKKMILLRNGSILPVYSQNDIRLASENMGANRNDEQLQNVINHYQTKIF